MKQDAAQLAGLDIIKAILDKRIFGSLPLFKKLESVKRWLVLLKLAFGLPLDDAEWEIAKAHTGRSVRPAGPFRECWVRVGRRGGKTIFAAIVLVYLAVFVRWNVQVGLGYILCLASDKQQAGVVFSYVRDILRLPIFRGMIESETREEIRLKNRIVISVHTANFRSLRGYRILAAVCDEMAFWRSEDSSNPAGEVLTALYPALGENPGSLLWVISTPHSRSGPFFQTFRDKHGTDDAQVLTWTASTLEMNPTYSASVIERARAEDPQAARAEFDAEWRDDVSDFMPAEAVEAVTIPGRLELPRLEGVTYHAWCDPSSGRQDSMTLAIAHRDEKTNVVVLDVLRERRPPFAPEGVVAEFADMIKAFGISEVRADRYAIGYVQEAYQRNGIIVENSEQTASEIFLNFLPLVLNRSVELLESKRLASQLAGLERKARPGGKDQVGHYAGGHDDLACAAAGACVMAGRQDDVVRMWSWREDRFMGGAKDESSSQPYERPKPAFDSAGRFIKS